MANWASGIIIFVVTVYSVAIVTERYGFIAAIVGGVVTGALVAGLLRLVAWVARRIRVKNPKPWMRWTGTIIYWLGCALAIYLLGLTIYAASQYDGSSAAVSVIGFFAASAVFYWGIAWTIRYLLGHQPRGSAQSETSQAT